MTSGKGRIKKLAGGTVAKKLEKYVRTTIDDVRDASKKLNPHQEPRSKKAASIRRLLDNAKKKKITPNPHVDPKKRMGPAGTLARPTPKYKPLGDPKKSKSTPMRRNKPGLKGPKPKNN
tara:strand:+ start:126 stop:482 length:357 start_codon:yes stop_codon:yes gene_type:complete